MINFLSAPTFKKWSFLVPALIHLVFIALLTFYTSCVIDQALLPLYLLFSITFLYSTLFSLYNLVILKFGVFYYLLNMMFVLGFWFKYSIQKITYLNYTEPIGTFIINSPEEFKVLLVAVFGILGLIFSQIFFTRFINLKNLKFSKKEYLFPKEIYIFILISSLLLAYINLKYNILLLGLKPSLLIPLKGNAIYFLVLTRGLLFLFLFYCLRNFSLKTIFLGAIIASICSIGVLSRMVVLIYFAVIFVIALLNLDDWGVKKSIINIFSILMIFAAFSYLTVFSSTGLRSLMQSTQNQTPTPLVEQTKPEATPAMQENKYFDIKKRVETYKILALSRWIGIEGVMAVESYPRKSFNLLWSALKEKSYSGNSFYTEISEPYSNKMAKVSQAISSSVPGPIAFFYYSGNIVFVLIALFFSTLLFSSFEYLSLKAFNQSSAIGIFISTFIVFDFFQFGISPLAFVRYMIFSFFSITVFYYLIRKKLLKGPYEIN